MNNSKAKQVPAQHTNEAARLIVEQGSESDRNERREECIETQTEHSASAAQLNTADGLAREINGPAGLEPTRYGDWESKGRCHDF